MDQVVQHLLTKGPLVAGTLWLRDMFAVDSKGFLRVGGTEEGGHAYLVLGVDLERKCPDGSAGSLLIANSWGRRWGKKDAKGKQTGRAFISMKDFQTLMAADGEVATVTEVKRN